MVQGGAHSGLFSCTRRLSRLSSTHGHDGGTLPIWWREEGEENNGTLSH
jgi:hypothetical protein